MNTQQVTLPQHSDNLTKLLATAGLTTNQQKYLHDFINRYSYHTKTSKQISQTSRPFLADDKNLGEFDLLLKEMYYPIVANRSSGSKIWDVDDNEYVDVVMGLGINLFGHNPSFIKEALISQLDKGIQLGLQSDLVGEVAELFSQLTGMERVCFSNTGTEAVMTALRIARAITGRNKIVIFSRSYHGHFDGTLVKANKAEDNHYALPLAPGVLPDFVKDVLVLDYGNPESLEIIKTHQQELAAVLVVPVQTSRPALQPKEFLHQLRELTQANEIALIFDEMVTGFRIHSGGAQAYFGVQADIATYGKIVGGGMPIGVIAGKSKYMDAIDGGMWNYGDDSYPQTQKTFFAGTFCKHPLAMTAAKSVLQYLQSEGPSLHQKLNERTTQFISKLNDYFTVEGLPLRMANFGSIFGSASLESAEDNSTASVVMSLLKYHLLDKGVHLLGVTGFLSTAHTDEDINYIIQAVKDSLVELRMGEFLPPRASV
ncbi:aspartate aminotransferase family protein [Anabaena azotica]|uniref:Aspartate aminotransferase family protein n=1 Tax=Anabaena azotica FACHB-119 TaxID=947527 RepID=A0ABR8D2N1_9NOST|nr:aspartate aminotransferase family protein [Anabaena azotica]MBD2500018.1 aspartate aminotransferase family protein [Anabaena azotica FACHB-119]